MVRETRHLWVGNLPDNIREDRIREHFKRYGRVQSVKLLARGTSKDGNSTSSNSIDSGNNVSNNTSGVGIGNSIGGVPSSGVSGSGCGSVPGLPNNVPSGAPGASGLGVVISSNSGGSSSGCSGLACTVAFMDIKSAAKAHTAEHKIDDRTLTTEYYEPAAIPSPGSNSVVGSGSISGSGGVVSGGVVGGSGPYVVGSASSVVGSVSRFANSHGSSDEHSGFTDRFYERSTSSRVVSDGEYLSRRPGYHEPPRGRARDRLYRTGAGGAYTTMLERRAWGYEPASTRYATSGPASLAEPSYPATVVEPAATVERRVDTTVQSLKKKTKSRSGSESPSGSASSRSPSRSRSTSPSTSSATATSSRASSSPTRSPQSAPRGRSLQSTVGAPTPLQVRSDDRRPLAICVRNLPARSSDTSLKDGLFHEYKKHGKVTSVRVVGQSADRYALVRFKKPEDVEKALEVSYDKLFFGCKIEVAPHRGRDVDDGEFRPYEAELDEFHPKATRTLFVGNLEKDVTASELRKRFEPFGEIVEVDVKKQGAVGGYAFCQFADITSVVEAIRTMDGERFGDNRIKLGFGKSMPTNCVWVDGVADSVSDKHLSAQFHQYGQVTDVSIDRERGRALVFFEQIACAQAAVKEMRGITLRGRRLQVDFASRECQDAFYERLEKKQVNPTVERPPFDPTRSFESASVNSNSRFRYDTPTRPRTSSYSRSSAASSQCASAVPSPGSTSSRLRIPRYSEYYDGTEYTSDRRFRNYDEFSQGSGEDAYEREYSADVPTIQSVVVPADPTTSNINFAPPDIRHLQKERVHLLEQLEECPSSGDERVSSKKRSKIDLSVVDASPVLERADVDRKSDVRRSSDGGRHSSRPSRRPSVDDCRTVVDVYAPHPVCKRRKTSSSLHRDASGGESIDGSRPGTPLCDERPENTVPCEPRRMRERSDHDAPLCLPLPKFAAQFRGAAARCSAASPPATVAPPPPPSPVNVPPPASPPPRPLSSSSNSSDGDVAPASPSLDERIKSLDEKYEKWSGSRTLSASGGDALAKIDASISEKFRFRHKLLDFDLKEVPPSEIVKSVLARRSVFDEDSKRLENFGEKYEPREFPTRLGVTPGCIPVGVVAPQSPYTAPAATTLRPSSASIPKGLPSAKGLQYPFPSHPPAVPMTPGMPLTPSTPSTPGPLPGTPVTPRSPLGLAPIITTSTTCVVVPTDPRARSVAGCVKSTKTLVTSPRVPSITSPIIRQSRTDDNVDSTKSGASARPNVVSSNVSTNGPNEVPTMNHKISSKGSDVESISHSRDDSKVNTKVNKITCDITRRITGATKRDVQLEGNDIDDPSKRDKKCFDDIRDDDNSTKSNVVNVERDKKINSDICDKRADEERRRRAELERIEEQKKREEAEKREKEDAERLERERIEREQRVERERIERERLEKERADKERAEKERAEREKAEKERQERLERERRRERDEREKREREEREKREKLEKEKAERERLERERSEKLEKEKRERIDKEKERADKAAEREKIARDKQDETKCEKESRRHRDDHRHRENHVLSDERGERNSNKSVETNHIDSIKLNERHRENHIDARNTRDDAKDFENTRSKDCEDESSKKETKDRDGSKNGHEITRHDSDDRNDIERKSHDRDVSRNRHRSEKDELLTNRHRDVSNKKEKENREIDHHDRRHVEIRHASLDGDRTRQYVDRNSTLTPNRLDVTKEKRKERNNSSPASIGLKRRVDSQDSLDNAFDDAKRMRPNEQKKTSDRRDSKDGQRSNSDRPKHNRHKNDFAKSLDEKVREDKKNKDIADDRKKEQDKEKDREQDKYKTKRTDKHRVKSKNRDRDAQRETSKNPTVAKESSSDRDCHKEKDVTAVRVDIRINEETMDDRQQKQSKKEKKNRQHDMDERKNGTEDSGPHEDKKKEKHERKISRDESTMHATKSEDRKTKKDERRVRKTTNGSDTTDSDEPKKHSIFDIVDDEPAYISMYDKVKARSCKNMQKQEEEKRQEKIKAKFTQLKQSRAKREEKKRSTSWDEDSDSDRSGREISDRTERIDTSERRDVTERRDASGTKHGRRTNKPRIASSSDDEPRIAKRTELRGTFSVSHDTDHSIALAPCPESSDDDGRLGRNRRASRKSSKSRITSDTSEDEPKRRPNENERFMEVDLAVTSTTLEERNRNEPEIERDSSTLYEGRKYGTESRKTKIDTIDASSDDESRRISSVGHPNETFTDKETDRTKYDDRLMNLCDASSEGEGIVRHSKNGPFDETDVRKKHKKKQKRQKNISSVGESIDAVEEVDDSEREDEAIHEEKIKVEIDRKKHGKKDKRRDKVKEDNERVRDKSKKIRKLDRTDVINKSETASATKRDEKMQDIFGPFSDDSENAVPDDVCGEASIDSFFDEFPVKSRVALSYNADSDGMRSPRIEDREKAREESKRRKEKKRKEKEQRRVIREENENSVDLVEAGRALEAKLLDGSVDDAADAVEDGDSKTDASDGAKTESTETDVFRFTDGDESQERDAERREIKEKKKKRKKSKEEKHGRKDHHHHHHHRRHERTEEKSISDEKRSPIVECKKPEPSIRTSFDRDSIENSDGKTSTQSLPSLIDVPSPPPLPPPPPPPPVVSDVTPKKVLPTNHQSDGESQKTPRTPAKPEKKKFIPGFGSEIDEKIHESAVKSISEFGSPNVDRDVTERIEPDVSKTDKGVDSVDDKPRVVISQEETEDAVAALLGESFGVSESGFDRYDAIESPTNVNTNPPEDDEEMRRAVRSLDASDVEAKPDTPQSEHDLQIDTDTEGEESTTLRYDRPPRTPDPIYFSRPPKTPDVPPRYYNRETPPNGPVITSEASMHVGSTLETVSSPVVDEAKHNENILESDDIRKSEIEQPPPSSLPPPLEKIEPSPIEKPTVISRFRPVSDYKTKDTVVTNPSSDVDKSKIRFSSHIVEEKHIVPMPVSLRVQSVTSITRPTIVPASKTVLNSTHTILNSTRSVMNSPNIVLNPPNSIMNAQPPVLNSSHTVLSSPSSVLNTSHAAILNTPQTVLNSNQNVLNSSRTVLNSPRPRQYEVTPPTIKISEPQTYPPQLVSPQLPSDTIPSKLSPRTTTYDNVESSAKIPPVTTPIAVQKPPLRVHIPVRVRTPTMTIGLPISTSKSGLPSPNTSSLTSSTVSDAPTSLDRLPITPILAPISKPLQPQNVILPQSKTAQHVDLPKLVPTLNSQHPTKHDTVAIVSAAAPTMQVTPRTRPSVQNSPVIRHTIPPAMYGTTTIVNRPEPTKSVIETNTNVKTVESKTIAESSKLSQSAQNVPQVSNLQHNISHHPPNLLQVANLSQVPSLVPTTSNLSQASDSSSVTQNIPQVHQNSAAQVSSNLSQVLQNLSQIPQSVPQVTQNLPQVSQNLLQVSQKLLNTSQNLPQTPQKVLPIAQNISQTIKDLVPVTQAITQDSTQVSNSVQTTAHVTQVLSKSTQVLANSQNVTTPVSQTLPNITPNSTAVTQVSSNSSQLHLTLSSTVPTTTAVNTILKSNQPSVEDILTVNCSKVNSQENTVQSSVVIQQVPVSNVNISEHTSSSPHNVEKPEESVAKTENESISKENESGVLKDTSVPPIETFKEQKVDIKIEEPVEEKNTVELENKVTAIEIAAQELDIQLKKEKEEWLIKKELEDKRAIARLVKNEPEEELESSIKHEFEVRREITNFGELIHESVNLNLKSDLSESVSVIKETDLRKYDDEKTEDAESGISDMSKENMRLSADILESKEDPLDSKEDSDYWSAKEVNIESVIKKVDALCSADELSEGSEVGKDDWFDSDNKSTETEPKSDKQLLETSEKSSTVEDFQKSVDQTDTDADNEAETFDEVGDRTEPRETTRVIGKRGGRLRGRKNQSKSLDRSVGGVQTRRGTKKEVSLSVSPRRGGARGRGAKTDRKVKRAGDEEPSSDVYEFHDDSDESKDRPRLILTIKSPASNAPNTTPTAVVKESPQTQQNRSPVSNNKNGEQVSREFVSPASNTRKSRRLQEKDISRNTVDDIIEDVVRNSTVVTRSAAAAAQGNATTRRSTRQQNVVGKSIPQQQQQQQQQQLPPKTEPRKSPRATRRGKDRRVSETADDSSEEKSTSRAISKKEESIDGVEVEKVESSTVVAVKDVYSKPTITPVPGPKSVEKEKTTAKIENTTVQQHGLKAVVLRRVKGNSEIEEPQTLIDPVTGLLMVMKESEEGQYIPVSTVATSDISTTTVTTTRPLSEPAPTQAEVQLPRTQSQPNLTTQLTQTQVSVQQSKSIQQPIQQPIQPVQPVHLTIIKENTSPTVITSTSQQASLPVAGTQAKPQSLKAHVLSSQAAKTVNQMPTTNKPTITVNQPSTQQISQQITRQPNTVVKPNDTRVQLLNINVSLPNAIGSIGMTLSPRQASKQVSPHGVSRPSSIHTPTSQSPMSPNTQINYPKQHLLQAVKSPQQQKQNTPLNPKTHLLNAVNVSQQVTVTQHMTITQSGGPVHLVKSPQIGQSMTQTQARPVIVSKNPPLSMQAKPHGLHVPQQIMTGAVASPPLKQHILGQQPTVTGASSGRISAVPNPGAGVKGAMEPPKQDTLPTSCLIAVHPILSPQSQTRGQSIQAGFPVPSYESSLAEPLSHLGPPLPPAHYVHPHPVYQQYLRVQHPFQVSRSSHIGGGLEKYGDGQEGEEAPVTSPPLELRRPGSGGTTLGGSLMRPNTNTGLRPAAVPHSLQSPHDRATDSPQVAQVYVHGSRMPPYAGAPGTHGTSTRYYESPGEPPPAHRTHTGTPSAAHSGTPVSLTHQAPPPGHIPPPSLGLSQAPPPNIPLGAGLGAAGNLSGAAARHGGQGASAAETPVSQRGILVATPPHASQVPPQADSLLSLLSQRYPVMWQGLLALKNDQAAVQMYFVFGNPHVARDSLPCNSDGSTPPLRIAQRMRLEQTQIEGVARKMQMENEHCMLLALPCGRDCVDVLQQSTNLQNGFITYLQQKQAAGIVNIAEPGSQQAAYVIHIFPSCDFANDNLARIAPDLLHRVADITHLLIIIATV